MKAILENKHQERYKSPNKSASNVFFNNPDMILKQANSGAIICELLLVLENKLSESLLLQLAKSRDAKERVFTHIESLSEDVQKAIIEEALDDKTWIGKFFRVQRGWRRPDLARGILAKLVRKNLELEEAGVMADKGFNILASSSGKVEATTTELLGANSTQNEDLEDVAPPTLEAKSLTPTEEDEFTFKQNFVALQFPQVPEAAPEPIREGQGKNASDQRSESCIWRNRVSGYN